MLTIKTYLDKSNISGVGLFTGEFIRQNKQVYYHDFRMTIMLELDEIRNMHPASQEQILKYCYDGIGNSRLLDAVYFNIDDSRFINHSITPNLIWNSEFNMYVAADNIEIGAELTCDYSGFCEKGKYCFNFK